MEYKRIRDLREDKDLLQKDVANFLNMTQQQYSRYETSIQTITTELLIKLAKFYNVSTDYILGLTNTKKTYSKK